MRQKAILEGQPPPNFDPTRPIQGQYDLASMLKAIKRELGARENVIIDTSKLAPADLAQLRQALAERGLLDTKVILHP